MGITDPRYNSTWYRNWLNSLKVGDVVTVEASEGYEFLTNNRVINGMNQGGFLMRHYFRRDGKVLNSHNEIIGRMRPVEWPRSTQEMFDEQCWEIMFPGIERNKS